MAIDLLKLLDYEPPMGDLGVKPSLSFCRGIWTRPIAGEDDAPALRIIHARILQMHAPARLSRLGLMRAPGYHKCGSRQDPDWVVSFRVLIWKDDQWQVLRHEQDVDCCAENSMLWFDLGDAITSAVIVEIRKAGVDEWWTSWNLAAGGMIIEGEPLGKIEPRDEKTLASQHVSLAGLPQGVSAQRLAGQVRYRTRFFDVGFFLNRAGFSFLSIDGEGQGKFSQNLLKIQPGVFYQGIQLHPVGGRPIAAPTLRYNVEGHTSVIGNHIAYDVTLNEVGLNYRLAWEIHDDRLVLRAERTAETALRAWTSSAWTMGIQPTVSPVNVLGAITRSGETGNLSLPVIVHAPTAGSLKIQALNPGTLWRFDAFRPIDLIINELKLGEAPQPEGDYLIPAGQFQTELEISITEPALSLRRSAPEELKRAIRKTAFTALTYRPDTATLSNNSASIHCPISMDNWSAITTRMGELLPGLKAVDLLRASLERWLDGGPGYSSGKLLHEGESHDAEDEYLMTGAACLLGLAEYLSRAASPEWVTRYLHPIQRQVKKMRARDLDDDGLIESDYRTGISGSGQWSTCWWDVISFGWKDAFANALLYAALNTLAQSLPKLGVTDVGVDLNAWAEKLHGRYFPTFFNPETGWLAGWRCKKNQLHDHAFLFVNGVAISNGLVEPEPARTIMEKLWQETKRVNMPDPIYGLPGNLWHIPDADLADIMQGYPLGYYQNGGRTHSQARHFVNALYAVGMTEEADFVLRRLALGLAEGLVFGGCKSGVDWRFWDDRPSGYEGLLTDQFGVLAVILERYRE
ncbi:MAG: hypothetical protein ACOY90_03035 [Candidatus Zhuqueibacterota bacterium]